MAGLKHKRKQQARKAPVAPLTTTNTPALAPTAAPVVGLAPTVIVAPPAERFDWTTK